jgi:hypothetical protein
MARHIPGRRKVYQLMSLMQYLQLHNTELDLVDQHKPGLWVEAAPLVSHFLYKKQFYQNEYNHGRSKKNAK